MVVICSMVQDSHNHFWKDNLLVVCRKPSSNKNKIQNYNKNKNETPNQNIY